MTRVLFLSPLLLALTGCVGFSPDSGMDLVRTSALREEHAEAAKVGGEDSESFAAERARTLLRRPLTADTAVRVAFLRNKGLQAAYSDLGISEARFVAASLPPNLSISLLDVRNDFSLDIERRLAADVLALATLPAREEIAEAAWRGAIRRGRRDRPRWSPRRTSRGSGRRAAPRSRTRRARTRGDRRT